MNVAETVKKIKLCTTLEELKAFESDERETVIKAVKRQREILFPSESEPSNNKEGDNSSENSVKKPENSEEPSNHIENNKTIDNFVSKIPMGCETSNIISFAEEFFGDNLKSAKLSKNNRSVVDIKLVSGEKASLQGI